MKRHGEMLLTFLGQLGGLNDAGHAIISECFSDTIYPSLSGCFFFPGPNDELTDFNMSPFLAIVGFS